MLRDSPALQFVFGRFAALLRGSKDGPEAPVVRFQGEVPDIAGDTNRKPAVAGLGGIDATAAKRDDRCEREILIRRRWAETGIRMWNATRHGDGKAALNIQGQAGLLPARSGETQGRYDKLEFRLIQGRIVCEEVVVDPPSPRR